MKTTDRLLLALFLLSIPLCLGAWFLDLRLLLFLPALPFFCLQLLLSRRIADRLLRLLPLGLILLWAGCGTVIVLTSYGWDALLGLIMLWAAISPAVGCGLGWLVWFRTRKKRAVE